MTIAKRDKDDLLEHQRDVGLQMKTDFIRSECGIYILSVRRNGDHILTKSNTLHVLASIQTVGAPHVKYVPLSSLMISDKRARTRRAGVSIYTLKWFPRLWAETSYLLDRIVCVESIQTVGASQVYTKPLRSCARPRRAGVSIDEAEGQIYRKKQVAGNSSLLLTPRTPFVVPTLGTRLIVQIGWRVEERFPKVAAHIHRYRGAQVHEVRAQNLKVAQVEPPAQQPAPPEPAAMHLGELEVYTLAAR